MIHLILYFFLLEMDFQILLSLVWIALQVLPILAQSMYVCMYLKLEIRNCNIVIIEMLTIVGIITSLFFLTQYPYSLVNNHYTVIFLMVQCHTK